MSYFDHMRSMHPLCAGDTHEGKLVTRTCYKVNNQTNQHIAVFMFEGEDCYRKCDTGEFYNHTIEDE